MRKILNNFLSSYKLKLIQLKDDFEPVWVQGSNITPSYLNYATNNQPIIMEVPLEKGRALPIFSFSRTSTHPYVLSVQHALNSEYPKETIKKTLAGYFTHYQPLSAGSLLGLPEAHPLHKEPHWAAILPWNADSLENWKIRVQKSVAYENKLNGIKIDIKDGWAWAGPVSPNKLNLEAERLFKTFQSVRKVGYKRNDSPDGDIHAHALIAENGDWVWQAQFGQHRASVVSGLAFDKVPVRINRIIYRAEVSQWPNVLSGLFTKEEALQVFDMIFQGNYPAEAADWAQRSNLLPINN